jgi:hypothetical protein
MKLRRKQRELVNDLKRQDLEREKHPPIVIAADDSPFLRELKKQPPRGRERKG